MNHKHSIVLMKRGLKRLVGWSLAIMLLIVAILVVYTWMHWSPAGAVYEAQRVAHIDLPHRLRTGEEHDAARSRNGGNPYVLSIETDDAGVLLYYGASHATDPKHPQIADITARWESFQPTVALYEGRSRGVVMSSHGRTGVTRWLFGSVAHKVMQEVTVPVMIVRPEKE